MPGAGWAAVTTALRSCSPTNAPEIPMTRRRAVARRRAVSGRIMAATISAADSVISGLHRGTIARRRTTVSWSSGMEGIVPVSVSGGDRGASRFEAIATWLSLWIAAGVFLVGWATQTGQTESATFSIYHVPGYLGLIALLAVVGERMFDRSAGGGVAGRLRSAWAGRSAGERVIVVGTVVLLAYVVLDILWQLVFGIGNGVDGRFAPTRLLLPVGLTLVASGWIVGAVVGGHRPGWLGAVAFTTILTVLNFWIGPWHAVFSPWSARPTVVADDLRTEIWTMAPDGNGQTRVVLAGPNEASEPVWSPDGQRIAYVNWTHGPGDLVAHLWTVSADGSD